ncbi:MAG: xanthine dehydrogenase accessory protein XdhC [Proteobacteria bacterium]|nr:xanthine dehydrogenase accessory protein XdhC [Pseudomonadota bacterium]
MSNWQEIQAVLDQEIKAAVLITVGRAKGSVPRETGATMLVSAETTTGTIGGGRLEYLAIETARDMLSSEEASKDRILNVPLGPELAQCCGGQVDILLSKLEEEDLFCFNRLNIDNENSLLITEWRDGHSHRLLFSGREYPDSFNLPVRQAAERCLEDLGTEIVSSSDTDFTMVQSLREDEFKVVVYGAGHVGRKVVQALAPLPCRLYWIDERPEVFPEDVSANVEMLGSPNPVAKIAALPPNAFHLVMTHSHQRDLEICEALLRRCDEAYIGLIGSATKKAKFKKRLALRGYSDQQTARIICPIGIGELTGKRPAEIAASVAADILLRHQHSRVAALTDKTETA